MAVVYKNEKLIDDISPINLANNDRLNITYTTTGVKNDIMFPRHNINGTIRITGGADDVFTLQTNIAGNWVDYMVSQNGSIPDLTIIGKGKGFRINISTITSASIILEVLL